MVVVRGKLQRYMLGDQWTKDHQPRNLKVFGIAIIGAWKDGSPHGARSLCVAEVHEELCSGGAYGSTYTKIFV